MFNKFLIAVVFVLVLVSVVGATLSVRDLRTGVVPAVASVVETVIGCILLLLFASAGCCCVVH